MLFSGASNGLLLIWYETVRHLRRLLIFQKVIVLFLWKLGHFSFDIDQIDAQSPNGFTECNPATSYRYLGLSQRLTLSSLIWGAIIF